MTQPSKKTRRTLLVAVALVAVVLVAVGAILLTTVQRPAEKIKIEW